MQMLPAKNEEKIEQKGICENYRIKMANIS